MTRPSHSFSAVLLFASALGAGSLFATAVPAASDVQQIKLGDRFTGTIATAGADTVAARFNAVQGTLISVKVRAARGSTVEPTITLLDKSGVALDLGPALSERRRKAWLRKLELPASGHYTLVIVSVTVDAEGVQSGVDTALAFLQDLEEDALLELIADLTAVGNAVNLDDERLVDDAAEIAEIVFGESHGRQAITVTFVDGSVVGPTRVSDISVVDPAGVDIGQLYDFADARLIKAGWNWNLVNNDGSRGVHNPTFAFQVLDASIDALSELAME